MQQTSQSRSRRRELYYDQARLQTISIMLCARLDDLFDKLDVGVNKTSKMYYGCCPVHGGNNRNAFNLYHGGDVPGKWVCRTRHCEETFKKTVIGFVRGMLSRNKFGYGEDGNTKTVTFEDAVDWCCSFLGQTLDGVRVDYAELEKRNFTSAVTSMFSAPAVSRKESSITRATIRERLRIPASYMQGRGWSAEVLNHYDVGLCDDPSKPQHERVVVPVYDDEYRYCVGVTGRSIHERCEKCRLWHNPANKCPGPHEELQFPKWKNSFPRENYLYNYWFAAKHIRKDSVAVLVEGPGDLWRLVESGIEHGLAMFGLDLTDRQQVLLERSGVMTLIVLTNMDGPGRDAAARIRKEQQRNYRIWTPDLPANDLGVMERQAVKSLVQPLIEKAKW